MPNMDGFTATREIRLREAHRQAATPGAATARYTIIAVTANALQGDRELCLQAGMDDYLPKPFGRDQLAACLERWLPRQDSAPSAARLQVVPAPDAPAEHPADSVATPAPLDMACGVLPAFDAAVLQGVLPHGTTLESPLARSFLTLFASEAVKLVAAIERAGIAHACDDALLAAHTLKSAGGSVGAVAINALARKLEGEARAGNAAGLAAYSTSLRRELERFLADVTVQRLTAQLVVCAA